MDEKRVEGLEVRVQQLETKVAVIETDVKHINQKLDKIDNNTTWLLRIVIGAVILAILGFIITQPKTIKVSAQELITEVVQYIPEGGKTND